MNNLKHKPALTSQPSFRALVDALPDAVMATDHEGNIIFGNHAAQAFTGMGEKTLSTKTLHDILGPASAVHEALAAGEGITMRDLAIMGRSVNSVTLAPVDGGQFMLVIDYETVPMKSEWVARMQRSLKPAQHIARMLAHEIKNPLAGIRGAAQLLEKSELSDDDKELAALIANEAQRIARLIDKVNVFEDAPRHQYTAVNLHEALEQAVKVAQSAFSINIVKKYDPSLPPVLGHHDRLVQALLNLVKNAAEAGGTEIIIRSWYDTAAAFHPESRARLAVCVAVEDNGQGIDPAIREHLFEPYHTTKAKGEGLGLSIVSKIIDDHGGAIDVASVPGRTVFKLSFPRGDKS